MDDELRDAVRKLTRDAMQEGSLMAIDMGMKVISKLVEEFTVKGNPLQACGAMAANEMLKELRKNSVRIFAENSK